MTFDQTKLEFIKTELLEVENEPGDFSVTLKLKDLLLSHTINVGISSRGPSPPKEHEVRSLESLLFTLTY